jgi:hypothetical protein
MTLPGGWEAGAREDELQLATAIAATQATTTLRLLRGQAA